MEQSTSQKAYQAGAYPGFKAWSESIAELPLSIKFAGIHLYTWVERGTQCQIHNKKNYLFNRNAVVQILCIIFMNVFLLPVLEKQRTTSNHVEAWRVWY